MNFKIFLNAFLDEPSPGTVQIQMFESQECIKYEETVERSYLTKNSLQCSQIQKLCLRDLEHKFIMNFFTTHIMLLAEQLCEHDFP